MHDMAYTRAVKESRGKKKREGHKMIEIEIKNKEVKKKNIGRKMSFTETNRSIKR